MKTKNTYLLPDPNRPLSWSAISSFEWNKDQWWKKYVGKEVPEITPELAFGSMIDTRIQDDPKFLPRLVRYSILQHEMRTSIGKLPLIGIADTFQPCPHCFAGVSKKKHTCEMMALRDFKTGRKAWDQKRADDTGQLTMYSFMLWQIEKIRPEDLELFIDWLPTHYVDGKIAFIQEGDIRTFKTKRTMQQVLEFGQRIIDTHAEMLDYCAHRPVLDTCNRDEW